MKRTKLKGRLMVLLIFSVLGLTSCGKRNDGKTSDDDSKYYFGATFNGVKKNFNFGAKFQGGGNNDKWEHIVISGHEPVGSDPTKLSPSLDIELWITGGNITTGTYDFNLNNKFISRYAIQIPNETIIYNTEYDKPKNYTVKITELSKDGIKGTFNGTIKAYNNEEKVRSYVITDGSFYLPYNK